RWWNFGGDTVVEVNRQIRLTPDRSSKDGWLWGRVPFTSSSWVVEFEFKVHGLGGSLYGDGFGFWYTADKETLGPVFGSKDEFTGLGVFFDTYSNGRHRHTFPYVNAMLGDGKTKYDHSNDGKTNEIGGCAADFRERDWPTKAKVKYIRDEMLQVQLNIKGDDVWEDCFIAYNISLPTLGYLGFSAWTGDVSDNHDIISVTT
ncbi:legume-like lectin, partial [Blyttiomyces helicus]